MGAVYEAIDKATSAKLAVKVLSSGGARPSKSLTSRFFREARATMGLDSPHVVRVLEAAIDPSSGLPFMVMELLDGEDLGQYLARAGTLSPDVALRVLAQACAGAQAAHDAGIVHRDIKPGNLFLARVPEPAQQEGPTERPDGTERPHGPTERPRGPTERPRVGPPLGAVTVKVLDFGIAKANLDTAFAMETTGLTRTGNLLGSPLYMSPEQARASRNIDRRADVWSLGIVLYRAISGRAPLQEVASLGEFILALCAAAPPALREIAPWTPEAVDAIAARALQLDPAARFPTASAMRDAILPLLSGGTALTTAMFPGLDDPASRRAYPRSDPALRSSSASVATTQWMASPDDAEPTTFGAFAFPGPATGPALHLAFPGPLTGPASGVHLPASGASSVSLTGMPSSGAANPVSSSPPLSSPPLSPPALPAAKVRRALAVAPLKNLTGRAETAWLAEAFGEMLAAELGATERIRVIDFGHVARVLASGPAAEDPAALGRALGADLLVTGSYLALQRPADLQIRLAASLHDVARAEVLATFAETGAESDMIALVSRAGDALRARLGVDISDVTPAPGPSFPEERGALRFYTEGLSRLRKLELPEARDLLVRAVEVSPEHPLPRAALAEAWLALGHDRKAEEQAREAIHRSGQLRREDRMFVEGRLHEICKDYGRAIESYRALTTFFPDELEYGLRLAGAQTLAGRGKEALGTLAILRKLPLPAAEDPRIWLGEAAAANSLSDYARELAAARGAAERAEAIGARLLLGRARISEAAALVRLGRQAEAADVCEAARRIFASAGDRAGEARAWNRVGNIAYEEGRLADAARMFGEALEIWREIGHPSGLAQAVNNIADTRLREGRLSAARPLFEQALAAARSTGDAQMAGFVLVNLADVRCQQGEYAEAAELAEQAARELGALGYAYGLHSAYSTLGTTAFVAGDLDRAEEVHGRALALARGIPDPRMVAFSLTHLARTVLPRGDTDTARRLLDESLVVRRSMGCRIDAAESESLLAEVSLRESRTAEAQQRIASARPVFEAAGMADHLANADALALLVAVAEGQVPGAQVASLESRLPAIENPLFRIPARMAAARARAARGDEAAARAHIEEAIRDADRLGIKGFVREAKLLAAEMPAHPEPRS